MKIREVNLFSVRWFQYLPGALPAARLREDDKVRALAQEVGDAVHVVLHLLGGRSGRRRSCSRIGP
eukprot:11693162-Alexandrium_andersonii.AAC.1